MTNHSSAATPPVRLGRLCSAGRVPTVSKGRIRLLCTPGTTICKGFSSTQVCNADGSAWVDGETCVQGGACWDGECLSPCEVNIKDGSYLGCEYWAMDLDNTEGSESQVVGVVVSVPANTSSTDVQIKNFATGEILSAAQLKVASTFVNAGEVRSLSCRSGLTCRARR